MTWHLTHSRALHNLTPFCLSSSSPGKNSLPFFIINAIDSSLFELQLIAFGTQKWYKQGLLALLHRTSHSGGIRQRYTKAVKDRENAEGSERDGMEFGNDWQVRFWHIGRWGLPWVLRGQHEQMHWRCDQRTGELKPTGCSYGNKNGISGPLPDCGMISRWSPQSGCLFLTFLPLYSVE